MKYALISEEQIKKIEDALEVSTTPLNADRQTVLQALAIVKSLTAQEPVAWWDKEVNASFTNSEATNIHLDEYSIPLFAPEKK